ncbi:hypothetical protein ASPZODRAFT_143848 [Penicilliopsis zonata CBS 506.65]|uniref:MACPF domain-containing protein n=1 Tax=Penicilliopsis zonata CBS 506.65 TaxID=1073090 RepID=A0A1L9SDA2_9EURO|nr:hypothetical protein ASPZODRAFT_143848 [Penicilliopsis zonata CBS 506.65]OJJ45200.1 hypothetical protein ASPZODRAFT_143848 [Penicilliopsis zonata CBS 506.65]
MADNIRLILLNYEAGKTSQLAALIMEPSIITESLSTIRRQLVKKDAMDRELYGGPRDSQNETDSVGAEVSDDTLLEDYLLWNGQKRPKKKEDKNPTGTDSTEGRAEVTTEGNDHAAGKQDDKKDEGVSAITPSRLDYFSNIIFLKPTLFHLYIKPKKIFGEMNAAVKAFYDGKMDLSLSSKPSLPSAKAEKLSSAYSSSAWAAGGSQNTTYAADMTERERAIVMRNNNLLCGQIPLTDDEGNIIGLQPAHVPAFAIKKRVLYDYDLPVSVKGDVDMEFRIPRYQIMDSANVDVMETQDALQTSMALSGFSQSVIQASAGGAIAGVSGAVKYGQTKHNSNGAANSKFNDKKQMYISYDFPRVELFLDEDSLKISKECQADLNRLREHRTKTELERFHRKYGYCFVPQVQLGGRLYSIEDSDNFGSASTVEKTAMFKAAAGASISGYGFQADGSWSRETSNSDKTETTLKLIIYI